MDRLSRVIAGGCFTLALGYRLVRIRLPQHAQRRAQGQTVLDQWQPARRSASTRILTRTRRSASRTYPIGLLNGDRRPQCTAIRHALAEHKPARHADDNRLRPGRNRRRPAQPVTRSQGPPSSDQVRASLLARTSDEARLAIARLEPHLNEPLSILFEDDHCLATGQAGRPVLSGCVGARR